LLRFWLIRLFPLLILLFFLQFLLLSLLRGVKPCATTLQEHEITLRCVLAGLGLMEFISGQKQQLEIHLYF